MTDGSQSSALVALIVGILLATWGFAILIALAYYVLMSIALMQFFLKVGVEPWIAWVPYYRTWKWLEVGGQPGWVSLLALVPYGSYAAVVFLAIGMHRSGIAFGKDTSWVVLGIFLPFVWCFLLARDTEHYDPRRIGAAGYPPPLAGFGAVPRQAPAA